ncbi:altronate hydrolase [Bacteroidetes bacterium SCGC AAA795-G10]|nr:altronate hydrolase [Bacteroidetes bacterium SCGC AAA795-G10]
MHLKNKILKIHPKDNIVVALFDLKEGEILNLEDKKISLKTDVNKKHKFALKNLNKGENIYLYGVVVGKAIRPIKKGEAINSKNISHHTQEYYLPKNLKKISTPNLSNNEYKNKTFDGYHRQDGKVGTENNWLVIPLVFCQNRNIDELKKALLSGLGYGSSRERVFNLDRLISNFEAGATKSELLNEKVLTSEKDSSQERLFSNVDGIYFLTHEGGCGGSKYDSVSLCNLIAGYINNPNVAGATILSLGCQHAQISLLEKSLKRIAPDFKKTIFFMEQQKSNSEEEYLAECIKKTFIGLIEANKIKRKPAPISKLTLGLECGGSDGFSGISANPVLGFVSDVVVGQGGSAILSEFPELNGVEQELINRCTSLEKAKKFKTLMQNYNKKATALGAGFDSNPSPGNIKDGLITDAIKSAGAAKKGGTSPIVDVLDYTEQTIIPGLNLLCTPGNDVESTTALAGSGANIILFTTGLGTPTGNPAVPVVKVSSNTSLYNNMGDIIDFNTGTIIDGVSTIKDCGEKLLNFVLEVASGRVKVCARKLGQNDFIPWKRGMSL